MLLNGDRLRQVTWAVDVMATQAGKVVGQQLERQHRDDILQHIHQLGHLNGAQLDATRRGSVALGTDNNGTATAGNNLFQGILALAVGAITHHNLEKEMCMGQREQ